MLNFDSYTTNVVRVFCLFITTLFLLNSLAQAQSSPPINFLSMTPNAQRLPEDSAPPGQSKFRFRGIKGTSYKAVFGIGVSPAMVVGVGADITSTSFDPALKQLTVNFLFDLSIVTEDGRRSDPNEFFIVIDPGAARSFSPQPRPTTGFPPPPKPKKAGISALSETTECYGPANKDTTRDEQSGPPLEAAGSWMSTNIASWCVIPPNEENPFFGFKLIAPSGTNGFFRKKIPAELLALLSTLAGKTLSADNIALYNGTFQSSKTITATSDGGVLINIELGFAKDDNTFTSKPAVGSIVTRGERASAATTTVTKTITTAEEEPLSLAPVTSTISGTRTKVFGFVADTDTGADGLKKRSAKTVIIKKLVKKNLITLGRATVSSSGTYSKSIRSSTVFSGSSSAKIVASVSGTTTTSRTVSLFNDTSD